ncbi:MAG: hypothetical protein D6683_04105 [Actinomyces sp.]|nr:MAG: hypothetical protein D6683_04105 [Actinomyces sp.]
MPASPPYLGTLRRLDQVIRPRTYIEVGVDRGWSLAASTADVRVGIDPDPHPDLPTVTTDTPDIDEIIDRGPGSAWLVRRRSDDAAGALHDLLKRRRAQFAFVDGLHLADQVIRDIAMLRTFTGRDAIFALHDVIPIQGGMSRLPPRRRDQAWTGDVWRVVPTLAAMGVDVVVDPVPPSGLAIFRRPDTFDRDAALRLLTIRTRVTATWSEALDQVMSSALMVDDHLIADFVAAKVRRTGAKSGDT